MKMWILRGGNVEPSCFFLCDEKRAYKVVFMGPLSWVARLRSFRGCMMLFIFPSSETMSQIHFVSFKASCHRYFIYDNEKMTKHRHAWKCHQLLVSQVLLSAESLFLPHSQNPAFMGYLLSKDVRGPSLLSFWDKYEMLLDTRRPVWW